MREELREFKRSRIVDAASRLFYERGYEATSIDSLASELNVTKPFIYSYFENKLAILEAVYQRSTERLVLNVKSQLDSQAEPADRLRQFINVFVHENIIHQASSGVFMREEKRLPEAHLAHIRKIEHTFDQALTALIQSGIDTGDFQITDAKLASLSISGMVRWVHRWYQPKGRLSPDDIANQLAEFGLNLVKSKS